MESQKSKTPLRPEMSAETEDKFAQFFKRNLKQRIALKAYIKLLSEEIPEGTKLNKPKYAIGPTKVYVEVDSKDGRQWQKVYLIKDLASNE